LKPKSLQIQAAKKILIIIVLTIINQAAISININIIRAINNETFLKAITQIIIKIITAIPTIIDIILITVLITKQITTIMIIMIPFTIKPT